MAWDWLDPIHGVGYQFWSGIAATLAALLIPLAIYATPTICSQLGCYRRARDTTDAGVHFCRKHMP